MNPLHSNADGKGGAILTLVRLLTSEKMSASEPEVEDVYYSDWAPNKAKSSGRRPRNDFVTSRLPSVVFLQEEVEPLPRSGPASLLFALTSVALFAYAVPTALEFFASQHLSPWASTILPGDIAGCLWLASAFRMRLLGLLLYILLTASESCLYVSGLVDVGSLVWLTDVVPALCVAAVITRLNQRSHS